MWQGTLIKMRTEWQDPVLYTLVDAVKPENTIRINNLVGRSLMIRHRGEINCIHCGQSIRKTFGEGSCYPCFTRLPQNDICILKPELCHYHKPEDPCRDPEWGERNCFIPHVLYLAVSSGLKVGITRHTQVPTRWMDQGASYALPVLRVADRFAVGRIEHALTAAYNDRTNWQRMLKHQVPEHDLLAERDRVLSLVHEEHEPIPDAQVYCFNYPALEWPQKVKSFNLEKTDTVQGRLIGIKGQYLILDRGVLNIRKHSGWRVTLDLED